MKAYRVKMRIIGTQLGSWRLVHARTQQEACDKVRRVGYEIAAVR
jgi:hypothetical protein